MGEENLLDLGGDDHGVQLIGQGGHLVQGRAWGRQWFHLSTKRNSDFIIRNMGRKQRAKPWKQGVRSKEGGSSRDLLKREVEDSGIVDLWRGGSLAAGWRASSCGRPGGPGAAPTGTGWGPSRT